MSNQRKAEFVSGNFGIQSFWGGYGEFFFQNSDLVRKVEFAQNSDLANRSSFRQS
jgi:hypothetical protein